MFFRSEVGMLWRDSKQRAMFILVKRFEANVLLNVADKVSHAICLEDIKRMYYTLYFDHE